MAACDANYRFIFFDVGSPGSEGDVNVFARSDLGHNVLTDATMNFPDPAPIDGEDTPFFFVGDDAFPLTSRIMKPFGGRQLSNEQKIFNYRLSRARRTIENAFGILAMRWSCLRSEFLFQPDKVKIITSASCVLHNFLLNQNCSAYATISAIDTHSDNESLVEAEFRAIAQQMDGLNNATNRGRRNDEASHIRNRVMDYVCTTDALEWQFASAYCVPDDE